METNIPKIKPEWLVGITMTSEQKAKWLAALRSGEYAQGWGELFNSTAPSGYCCLGVLASASLGISDRYMAGKNHLTTIDCSVLGDWMSGGDWADNPPVLKSIQDALSYINDVLKLPFPQIADFIEANIPACDEVGT